MHKDVYGLTVSTRHPLAVGAINYFIYEFIDVGKEMDNVLRAADAFPDSFLLQVYTAFFFLYAHTQDGEDFAKEYLARAKRVGRANEREKSLYRIALLWAKRELIAAMERIEGHCRRWPRDLTAVKIAEGFYFLCGLKFRSERFLSLTQSVFSLHASESRFLSMHAFALALNNQCKRAKDMAVRALELDCENPGAYHALSHCHLSMGEIDEGIRTLNEGMACSKRGGRLIESHNLWHLALLYLENLDFERVFAVYEEADWKNKAAYIGEEVDAAALLMRLDMHEVDVQKHWEKLAEAIGDHAAYPMIPFTSAQLLYALHRAGRHEKLKEALRHTEAEIKGAKGKQAFVWKEIGERLIRATLAFAQKNYEEVIFQMGPIRSHLGCCGGSDAQISLFHQILAKSFVEKKREREAQEVLRQLNPLRKKSTRRDALFLSCSN